MVRRSLVVLLCLVLVPFVPSTVAGDNDPALAPDADPVAPSDGLDEPVVEDGRIQLIVGHQDGPGDLPRLIQRNDGRLIRTDDALGFSVVQVPEALEKTFRLEAGLAEGTDFVTRDGGIEHMLVPDDTRYGEQWGPRAIGMESAWDIGRGDHNVTVAVLDTGVDPDHPDLADNVCSSGRDFVNDDMDARDDHGHGTHVAGTIAAHIDNGTGVAGMAEVCILPVKVLDSGGWGTWSGLASALAWTADQGVDIISISLGGCAGCDPGEPVTGAMKYAADAGVLIVAAAGNAYCSPVGYPAAYPEAIAVAALSAPGDTVASFSSCGPEVEVAAPGEAIISTVPTFLDTSGYATYSGTSMATPHVSGVAALLMSTYPGLGRDEVRCILAQRADDLFAEGRDNETGYGRIDADDMMLNPDCIESRPVAPDVSVLAGDLAAHITWTEPFAWGGVDGYEIYMGVGNETPGLIATVGDVRHYTADGLVEGTTYRFQVAAVNEAGTGETSGPVSVVARTAITFPYQQDFATGLADWRASGLWHNTTDRSGAGDQSAYFGIENGPGLDDNGYDTGRRERGDLTSPPIRVPESGPASLVFWQYAHLGWGFEEHPVIQVANASDPTAFQTVWEMSSIIHDGTAAVDLSPFAGEVVWLRFHVDTLHEYENDGEGWYVDDVTLVATTPPALAPLADILWPTMEDVVGSDGMVGVVFTDPNGDPDVANVSITVDGVTLAGEYPVSFAYLARYTGLATGDHTANATVIDQTGISTTDSVTFPVDGDPPTLTLDTRPGELFGCSITVSGTAADPYTGVRRIGVGVGLDPQTFEPVAPTWHYPIDHVSYHPPEASVDWTVTIKTSYLEAGDHLLVVAAWDAAGNIAKTNLTVTRDGTLCVPQVIIDGPPAGTTVACSVQVTGTIVAPENRTLYYAYVSIGYEYQEIPDGLKTYDFTFDVRLTHVTNGTFDIEVTGVDSEHDQGSASLTLVRDDTDCLPKAAIDSPEAYDTVSCTATVSGRAFAGPDQTLDFVDLYVDGRWMDSQQLSGEEAAFEMQADLVALGPGNHSIYVEVVQTGWTSNRSAPVVITRDGTDCYPTGEVLAPIDGTSAGCTIELAGVARAGSVLGVYGVRFFSGGRFIGFANLFGPQNGADTVGPWLGEALLGALATGPQTIDVRAFDGRHNERSIGMVDIVRDATDCTPELTLGSPEDGETIGCGVRVAGTAHGTTEHPIHYIEIEADGSHVESYYVDAVTVPFETWIPDWYFWSSGKIKVTVKNSVDGTTSETRTLVLEDENLDCRPTLTIHSPTDGTNVSGTSDIVGNMTAPPDVPVDGTVEIWIDHELFGSQEVDDGTFRITIDWTRLPDGPTTVVVAGWLEASRRSAHASVSVNVTNDVAPRLEPWSTDGTVGCSVRAMGLWLKDACSERLEVPVEEGLTGGRLVVEWESDLPEGIDHLAVSVTIGARVWSATSAPGDEQIVLEIAADREIRSSDGIAYIEVTAAKGTSPAAVAFDESFHIDGQWAYDGAEPTL